MKSLVTLSLVLSLTGCAALEAIDDGPGGPNRQAIVFALAVIGGGAPSGRHKDHYHGGYNGAVDDDYSLGYHSQDSYRTGPRQRHYQRSAVPHRQHFGSHQ